MNISAYKCTYCIDGNTQLRLFFQETMTSYFFDEILLFVILQKHSYFFSKIIHACTSGAFSQIEHHK